MTSSAQRSATRSAAMSSARWRVTRLASSSTVAAALDLVEEEVVLATQMSSSSGSSPPRCHSFIACSGCVCVFFLGGGGGGVEEATTMLKSFSPQLHFFPKRVVELRTLPTCTLCCKFVAPKLKRTKVTLTFARHARLCEIIGSNVEPVACWAWLKEYRLLPTPSISIFFLFGDRGN